MREKRGVASMEPEAGADERRKAFLCVTLVVLGSIVLNSLRAGGFGPSIFPDERVYSFASRHGSFAGAPIPNYLFYLVYGAVDLFGADFLATARVFNAVFYSLSLPFIYALARKRCGRATSLFLALITAFSPVSSYTVYFMPESLYFFGFWAFAWLVLDAPRPASPVRFGLAAGAAIGVLALVKTHGVFLLPGFVLYAAFSGEGDTFRSRARHAAEACLGAAVSFSAVRFGLGYLLAGPAGLNLLGTSYGSAADKTAALFDLRLFLYGFAYNLFGNIEVLCVLFALPLTAVLLAVAGRQSLFASDSALRRRAVFFLSFFVPLLILTASFPAVIGITGDYDMDLEIARVQSRYYNFLYPALLIVLGWLHAKLAAEKDGAAFRTRWACVPFVVVALFAVATHLRGYFIDPSPDCPELPGLFFVFVVTPFRILAVLAAVAALLSMYSWKTACKAYLFLFLPLYTLGTFMVIQFNIALTARNDPVVAAVHAVRDHLRGDTADLAVAGRAAYEGNQALFQLDDPGVPFIRVRDGEIAIERIPADKKWVLLFDGARLVPDVERPTFAVEMAGMPPLFLVRIRE